MMSFGYLVRSLDPAIQLIIAVTLGVGLGIATLFVPPLWLIVLLLAIPTILISLQRPEFAILGIVVLLCTLIPDSDIPTLEIAGGQLYMSDIIVAVLFLVIIARWLTAKDFKLTSTPLDLPIFAFWFWAILTAIIFLLQKSNDTESAIPEMRIISYYLIFFVVTNLMTKERNIEVLVHGLIFLATIVSAMMLAQYIVGTAFSFIPGRVEALVTAGEVHEDVTRIADTVGEGLITIAFITKTVILFIRQFQVRRTIDILQWALLGIAVILTFSRTHWLATVFALIIVFFMIREQDRLTLIKWVIFLFFLSPIVIVPILTNPTSLAGKLFFASVDRALSLTSEESYTSSTTSTFRWRGFEYTYGIPHIISHPVTGIGLGAVYRPYISGIDFGDIEMTAYTHNSHMWVAMKTGLVGYFFLLWFSILFIWRGFRRWSKISDPYIGGAVLGFTLSYLSAFLAANLHPIFVTLFWTPLIGIMMGINEAIYKVYLPPSSQEIDALPSITE